MNVFQIPPKRIKRVNGQVLTPEMSVTVTMHFHLGTPLTDGSKEVAEANMRNYGFDFKKTCCNANDFDFKSLG